MLLTSLHLETRFGLLSRQGSLTEATLRVARAVIRRRGLTLLQARQGATPEARQAWRQACQAAYRYWDKSAPAGCPRCPEIRLVLAIRHQRPG